MSCRCLGVNRIVFIAPSRQPHGSTHRGLSPPASFGNCRKFWTGETITLLFQFPVPCRVEEWRGSLGRGLFSPVARPFVRGCPTISTVPRFHSPLIEPDGPY